MPRGFIKSKTLKLFFLPKLYVQKKMGISFSALDDKYTDISQVPQLTKEAVQLILMRVPTSVLITNVLRVSKLWNQIGRQNIIWQPRYVELLKQVYGEDEVKSFHTNTTDYAQYELFGQFLRVWSRCVHVWIDKLGKITRIAKWRLNFEREQIMFIKEDSDYVRTFDADIKEPVSWIRGLNYFTYDPNNAFFPEVIRKQPLWPDHFDDCDFEIIDGTMIPDFMNHFSTRKRRYETALWIVTRDMQGKFRACLLQSTKEVPYAKIKHTQIPHPVLVHQDESDLLACRVCDSVFDLKQCSGECKAVFCSEKCQSKTHFPKCKQ